LVFVVDYNRLNILELLEEEEGRKEGMITNYYSQVSTEVEVNNMTFRRRRRT